MKHHFGFQSKTEAVLHVKKNRSTIFDNLDKDANVIWSFSFSDVPLGKRKVMLLLAS